MPGFESELSIASGVEADELLPPTPVLTPSSTPYVPVVVTGRLTLIVQVPAVVTRYGFTSALAPAPALTFATVCPAGLTSEMIVVPAVLLPATEMVWPALSAIVYDALPATEASDPLTVPSLISQPTGVVSEAAGTIANDCGADQAPVLPEL